MLNSAQFVLTSAHIILTGLIIGVILAAPLGPVNILCIHRTLQRGFWAGLASGVGAVLGDGLISTLAAFGLTAITETMRSFRSEIQLAGGVILIAFGATLLWAKPRTEEPAIAKKGVLAHAGAIPQTFFLTITNPGAVLGVFAIFGGLGAIVGGLRDYLDAALIVVSVMCGSLLWWFFLAWLITKIRHKLTIGNLTLINQVAGVALMGFGAGLIVRFALTRIW